MTTKTMIDTPIKELHSQQLAPQANTDLTTLRRSINVRDGFNEIMFRPVLATRVGLAPQIVGVYWYDDSAGVFNDLVGDGAMLDSGRTNAGSTFTLAVADFLYIGAAQRFGGARFDLDSSLINNNASTLTCQFPGPGKTWTDLAITNGTDSSGTFAQDGNITFTVAATPAQGVWEYSDLRTLTGLNSARSDSLAYWLRFDTSALLDVVEIEQLSVLGANWAAAIATAGSGLYAQAATEYTLDFHSRVGAIEFQAIAAAATTMDISWIRR